MSQTFNYPWLYFNNAGAGIASAAVISRQLQHLQKESEVGAYNASALVLDEVAKFYELAARSIGATDPAEIAFMDSASRAWDAVIYGSGLTAGDRILTLSSEFGTNLVSIFHYANSVGAEVDVLQVSASGAFDLAAFEDLISDRTRLVAISHVAAHGSIVNPVREIGEIVSSRPDLLYVIDGCQSVGQFRVDVNDLKCDAYTASGRKWLCGPRGTAFAYVRSGSAFAAPFVDLASADLEFDGSLGVKGVVIRDDARRFELWERSVAGLLGLGVALGEYIDNLEDASIGKIAVYANQLRRSVVQQDQLVLIGSEKSATGVVGFYAASAVDHDRILETFKNRDIGVGLMHDWDCPLHYPENGVPAIFRIAPHLYTTQAEIDITVETIESLG